MSQLSFSDIEMGQSRKPSRISIKLEKIERLVDWEAVFGLVKVLDRRAG